MNTFNNNNNETRGSYSPPPSRAMITTVAIILLLFGSSFPTVEGFSSLSRPPLSAKRRSNSRGDIGIRTTTKHPPTPTSTTISHGSTLVVANRIRGGGHYNNNAVAPLGAFVVDPFVASAILPTCLGFWRTGYTVSYGYGGAMLACGLVQLLLKQPPSSLLSKAHAGLYIFYGIRLCLFLLNREINQPMEIHQMKRRDATLGERLKRLPLVLGCSALYYMMAVSPMKIVASQTTTVSSSLTILQSLLVATSGSGFLLAAIGDWYKSKIKALKGSDHLVTTGVFRYFRHPNYTGEMIGWTGCCLLLPLLQFFSGATKWKSLLPWAITSMVGWAGIVVGVLMVEATTGLEQKQKEKYGQTPEYQEWIKTSWSGPMLSPSKKEAKEE